jgi:CubicO group peptidase (beta-lactamase class C family)
MVARWSLLAVIAAWPLASGVAHAQVPLAIHGYTEEQLGEWKNRGAAKDLRLIYLNGYDVGGTTRYAALAIKEARTPEYHWYAHLSLRDFPNKLQEYKSKGFRPICVNGYLKGNDAAFTLVMVHDGRRMTERIGLHLTVREYEERLALEKRQGYMPSMVSGYADGAGSYRFTALFVLAGKAVCKPQHDLTAEQYQKAMETADAQQLRPISISIYPTAQGLRYAAIFIHNNATKWQAKHNLTGEGYQAKFTEMSGQSMYPVSIVGYRASTPADPLAYNVAVAKFMAERRIPLGTFAVSRAGKLLHEGGVNLPGLTDKVPLPGTPMRLASLTKPITAAAVRNLIREGKLTRDTPAFALLDLKLPSGQKRDPRLSRITIDHLLDHKGGWDRDQAFDPMFRCKEIAETLKVPAPPGPVDIIRYMMGQPLQFDPGTRKCYSNFGYCVLGRVIEKVTGQPYIDYVQKSLLAPLGIKSVELGRTLPKYRNSREPAYVDSRKGRNVFEPENEEEVPLPDGDYYLEAMDSHGGLIGSSPDLVRFLEAYWISGERRKGNGGEYTFFGELPGTFTMMMQRPNGVNIAVMFNQSKDASGKAYGKIADVMREIADRSIGGELRYAALWVKLP